MTHFLVKKGSLLDTKSEKSAKKGVFFGEAIFWHPTFWLAVKSITFYQFGVVFNGT